MVGQSPVISGTLVLSGLQVPLPVSDQSRDGVASYKPNGSVLTKSRVLNVHPLGDEKDGVPSGTD